MFRELLPYLGYPIDTIPANAELSFVFNNAPESWKAFLFLAIVVVLLMAIWKLTQREHSVCPKPIKNFLSFIRCAVLIFLFLVFLDPALSIAIKKVSKPHIVFLLDNSASMKIQDKYLDEETQEPVKPYLNDSQTAERLAILHQAVKNLVSQEELEEKGELHYFSIDHNLNSELLNKDLLSAVQTLTCDKVGTDIAQCINECINNFHGKKISAIVLLSDGVSNLGAPLESVQESLKPQNIPIYAMGLGNYKKAKNISITELWAPERIFKDDPFNLQVKIKGTEMQREEFFLEIFEIPLNEQDEKMEDQASKIFEKKIIFLDSLQDEIVNFEYKPKKEGKYVYKALIAPFSFESFTLDNIKTVNVEVISKSAKVLLISGNASWDFRLLQTLLVRDKTIDVSSWLQSMDLDMQQDGDMPIKTLPDTEEELFKYDVIIMMDPNPVEFGEKWVLMLQKFIDERQGGFMYVAGPIYTDKFMRSISTQKIKDFLPVLFSETQLEYKDFMKVVFNSQWPLRLTNEGQTHYLGKLQDQSNQNFDLWKALPGVYWSMPIKEAKAGVKVILEHTDPKLIQEEKQRPLLVTSIYGGGRVIFMGFNGTWRWRKIDEKYFDRYWVQCIRFLIEGKLQKNRGKSLLYANKEQFFIGDTIFLNAKLFNNMSQPLEQKEVRGKVFRGINVIDHFILKQEINRKGFYEGEYRVKNTGSLRFLIDDDSTIDLESHPELKVTIELPLLEFVNAEMNQKGLISLSSATNGKFYKPIELNNLIKDLPNIKEILVINLPPESLWDKGRFYLFIVLLLTVEWFVRKKNKLL